MPRLRELPYETGSALSSCPGDFGQPFPACGLVSQVNRALELLEGGLQFVNHLLELRGVDFSGRPVGMRL